MGGAVGPHAQHHPAGLDRRSARQPNANGPGALEDNLGDLRAGLDRQVRGVPLTGR